jgi:biopolymer transport protein ExbB/TolQ
MQFNIFKSTAWQLILQSDWVCRLILLGLFALSIFCIAIIIYKVMIFRRHVNQLNTLLNQIKRTGKFQDIVAASKEHPDGIGGKFLQSILSELKMILEKHTKTNQVSTSKSITDNEIELLDLSIQQEISSLIEEEESYLTVLFASASSSTLIGLFGTIWGIIHSFIDIAQEKTADIATVAPGLAEALTTTLAGLIVAIPALVSYIYLTRQIHRIEFSLSELGDRFIRILRQTFNNQDAQ